jgi:hypothetical protein
MEHFLEAFRDANVDGALAASVFHKQIINIGELKTPGRPGRGDQGMLTEQQQAQLDWKNGRITAGGCPACRLRRSADAGLYEPGRAGENDRQRQSDVLLAHETAPVDKGKPRVIS